MVIDQGSIVQQGNHKQLFESDGLYSELWQSQSEGFID